MIIDQVLSGYDNGHRVLASSVRLERTVERTISIQSDLSGSSVQPEFDGYLSVYPIHASREFVAFAKTWYAHEKERPGCVWTHTLLLPVAEQQSWPVLALAHQFRRPQGTAANYRFYEQALQISHYSESETHISKLESDVLPCVLSCLFDDECTDVLLPAANADQFEQVALIVWALQWPNLRDEFSFSTGSLSNRSVGKRTFALQCVPQRDLRQIARSTKTARVISVGSTNASPPSPWASNLSSRVLNDGVEYISAYIRRCALGVPPHRQFLPIVATMAKYGVAECSAVDAILEVYPSGKSGVNTKALFLETALSPIPSELLFSDDREKIIRAIAAPASAEAFSKLGEKARALSRQLVRTNPELALRTMVAALQPDLNEIGVGIVKGVFKDLADDDLDRTINSLRDELPLLIALYPEIAANTFAWRSTRRQQYELCEALGQVDNLNASTRARIIAASLEGDSHDIASSLIRALGNDSLRFVLDWFNKSGLHTPKALHSDWRRELALNPRKSVDWFRRPPSVVRPATIALASEYISPTDASLSRVPTEVWILALQSFSEFTPPDVSQRSRAFLLAIAFNNRQPLYAEIAASTFESVHDLMLDRELGYEEWQWLSDDLPSLGWGWNWDRAERLRRGLIERFVDSNWPLKFFPMCISKHSNWDMVLSSCRATEHGKILLKRLREELGLVF